MQTFRCVTRQVALRPKICSIWSPTSATTSATTLRNFLNCSVWNESSKNLESLKDSKLSTESELSKDSKTLNGPELQKQRLRQYKNAWLRNKYATNAIWREQHLVQRSIYARTRRTTDEEFRNRTVENSKKHYNMKRDADPNFAIGLTLREWVYQSSATREQLSWKTHVPILTPEKAERYCASCGVKRRGGMRLFWRRRQVSQAGEHVYDCNRCFFNNPDIRLPEGFEHVKTVEQLRTRREQLLGIKTRPYQWRTASPPPST